MRRLHIDPDTAQGRPVIRLAGVLDARSGAALRVEVDRWLTGLLPGERLDLDLGGLRQLDSAGLSVLIAVYKRAVALGCRLVLLDVRDDVRRMLRIAGLIGVMELADAAKPEDSSDSH